MKSNPMDNDNIAKAKNAVENALWSIERAYLPPCQGAPAAFILITCLIDFLGTLYTGDESSEETFGAFVSKFMSGYNDKQLYRDLRHKLVHNYSIRGGRYILTHGRPERHMKLHGTAKILNLENFFNDVKQAVNDYFVQVDQKPALQYKLSKRISRVGTIEDVDI